MMSPCDCKGTSKYVHRYCLLTWQANTTVETHKFVCQSCQAPYNLSPGEFEKAPVSPERRWIFLSPNMLLSSLHLGSLVLSVVRFTPISLSQMIILVSTILYGTLYGLQLYQIKGKLRYIGFYVTNTSDIESSIKPMLLVLVLVLILLAYPIFPYLASIVYCHVLFNIFQVHRHLISTINQRLLLET